MPYAVTANRLRDGRVVFRTAAGAWSLDVADSAIEPDEKSAGVLAAALVAEADAQDVVDIYAVAMDVSGKTPRPAQLRERIRALGPTIAYLPATAFPAAE